MNPGAGDSRSTWKTVGAVGVSILGIATVVSGTIDGIQTPGSKAPALIMVTLGLVGAVGGVVGGAAGGMLLLVVSGGTMPMLCGLLPVPEAWTSRRRRDVLPRGLDALQRTTMAARIALTATLSIDDAFGTRTNMGHNWVTPVFRRLGRDSKRRVIP